MKPVTDHMSDLEPRNLGLIPMVIETSGRGERANENGYLF